MKYTTLLILITITLLACNKKSNLSGKNQDVISLNVSIDSTVYPSIKYIDGKELVIDQVMPTVYFDDERNFSSIEGLMFGLLSCEEMKHVKSLFWEGNVAIVEKYFKENHLIRRFSKFVIVHTIFVLHQDKKYYFIKFKDFYAPNRPPGIRGIAAVYENHRYYLLEKPPVEMQDIFEWSIKVKSPLAKLLLRPSFWDNRKIDGISPKYRPIIKRCKNLNNGFNLNKFNKIISKSRNKDQYYDEVYLFNY